MRLKAILPVAFACLWSFSLSAQPGTGGIQGKILAVLAAQEQAWNKGDVPGFMEGYWQSDSLAFVGKGGVSHGWQQVLANYQRNYPDQAAMGVLGFSILKIEPLGNKQALVIGKWALDRKASGMEDLGGHFTLLFKKIKGQWLIVLDHTS